LTTTSAQRCSTLIELTTRGADDKRALFAPGGEPLTYAALRALVQTAIADLNRAGVGRGDRVAIVLPNGPEMASAFIAVASAAAPLNPTDKADEFEFYSSDLKAKALVVEAGSSSPAVEVARRLGVRIVTLNPQPQAGAGAFTLNVESRPGTRPRQPCIRRSSAARRAIAT